MHVDRKTLYIYELTALICLGLHHDFTGELTMWYAGQRRTRVWHDKHPLHPNSHQHCQGLSKSVPCYGKKHGNMTTAKINKDVRSSLSWMKSNIYICNVLLLYYIRMHELCIFCAYLYTLYQSKRLANCSRHYKSLRISGVEWLLLTLFKHRTTPTMSMVNEIRIQRNNTHAGTRTVVSIRNK